MPDQSAGIHYILELYGCPHDLLDNEELILNAVTEGTAKARCTVISASSHKFSPQGVTAVALLMESHLSIHTWPERGYAAVDIFTCGSAACARQACDFVALSLKSSRRTLLTVPRGPGPARESRVSSEFMEGPGTAPRLELAGHG